MPDANFFTRFGIFVYQEFLSAELCKKIRSEVRLSNINFSAGITKNGEDRIDESIRKTKAVKVTKETKLLVKTHLLALQLRLEKHFHATLADCETPQFLAYREGDFFLAHTDSSTSTDAHEYIQQRRVSVVIFLNGESQIAEQDTYTGGALTFYGLIQQPRWEKYGFSVQGETGLLVAFSSDVSHEVTPVTQGERFSIVSWFF